MGAFRERKVSVGKRSAAIIVVNGQVALIERRRAGTLYYLFPGGQIKPGEQLEDTARREIQEELGLVVEIGRMVALLTFRGDPQYHFLAEVIGGEFGTGTCAEMTGRAPEHAGAYRPVWIPLEKLTELPLYPRKLAEAVALAQVNGWPSGVLEFDDPGVVVTSTVLG